MEGLQTTTIITCGVLTGYLLSFALWNYIKKKNTSRSVNIKSEVDECSSVDTHTRSLFTDSSASFHFPASYSIISSGSFVSACESLHERFHTLDLISDYSYRNSVIVNEFLYNGKSRDCEEGHHHDGDISNCSDILKMLLRKRPDNMCLEFLNDLELGDIMKNEIENQIRFCLQRN